MTRIRKPAALLAAALTLAAVHAVPAHAFDPPKVNSDGSVQVPAFTLPYSRLASPESKAQFIQNAKTAALIAKATDVASLRKLFDENMVLPEIALQKKRYAVTMEEKTIGGVFTQVFTPKDGVASKNRHRVLINLHGGGFSIGARTISQVESIPISAVGKIKVISVDYRQGPEHVFPAASEDVAAVYTELLKTYKPADIAIYGCSAGGMLTAQAMAWFQKQGLPNPAAIGIFCASTNDFFVGDSAFLSARLGGMLAPPPEEGFKTHPFAYLAKADMKDPLVLPSNAPEVLAKFPPTLFVTGTRAGELSGAVHSHIQLVKAGVDARLLVWEAMDHAFFLNPDLPESREAYDLMTKFFNEQMDKANKKK
jgi:acetyl esterase/lipase